MKKSLNIPFAPFAPFLLLPFFFLLSSPSLFAYAHWEGYCQQGGQQVVTSSARSTTQVQQSYPLSTLTVYVTGSSPPDKAVLYSDNNGTPLGNPLTCSKTGYASFYSANNTLDLTFSGTGIASPFTLGAVQAIDPFSLTVSSLSYRIEGRTFYQACADVVSRGVILAIDIQWAAIATTGTCAAPLQGGFTGGSIQPANGSVVTISGTVTAPPTQLFDISVGGAGSILLTGKILQVYPNWFGARMNGSTDDTAAWQGAIASLLGPGQTGGTVAMPGNVTSVTTTGIVITLNGQYLRIVGQDNSSVIQCTGVACVTWTGANNQGSGMSSLLISDPTGNSSTIGLHVAGGAISSNLLFENMRILGNDALQSGGHFAGLGVGVKLQDTTLARFSNVQVAYFHTDVLEAPGNTNFSSSMWHQSYMFGAGDRGWDIETSGDHWASQTDFEANTGTGIYMGANSQSLQVTQSHFEANRANQFDLEGAGAQFISSANNYEGGTALVNTQDSLFISNSGDNMGTMVVTVNSTGTVGLPGASFYDPIFAAAPIGTGCAIINMGGSARTYGSGCSLQWSVKGFTGYSVDGVFSAQASSSTAINAVDTHTSGTPAAGYSFQSLNASYPNLGFIQWEPGGAGGSFDFIPSYSGSGGLDYNLRNAAGSSIMKLFDTGALVLSGLPTSGTAVGSLCIDASNHVFVKTTSGPCVP